MAKLEKKKNQPTVCFPAEMEKEKFAGKFYGYHVEDTNYYNIVSLTETSNNKNIVEIGEVFFEKPNEVVSGKLTGYYENSVLNFVDYEGTVCKKELYSLKLDIFSRNTGILESDIMLKTGAMLIGCGSVGSLVALELAKAGVGRFMLIDNDIIGYHNICRHQCGVLDVGKYKTEAVKERILQINPSAMVITQNMIIQEVPLSVFDEFCDKETIVIGGADNREGDLYANQIAKEVGMPMMSIGFWERAFAGEIFYCLPDGMPDYSDFMWAIGDTSGRATQNRKFYTNEEDLARATFEPGISVDIDFVTVIAVKLALDILNRNNEHFTSRLLGHLSQFTLVCNTNNPKIGGDNAEIFSYPLQVTTSIEVPYAPKEK
jgi:molybdopterin/thiamine biosynthesis adenylyltransferase